VREAQWHIPSDKTKAERTADAGLPGRILRVLRESGEAD
jgi:hypothetical protein